MKEGRKEGTCLRCPYTAAHLYFYLFFVTFQGVALAEGCLKVNGGVIIAILSVSPRFSPHSHASCGDDMGDFGVSNIHNFRQNSRQPHYQYCHCSHHINAVQMQPINATSKTNAMPLTLLPVLSATKCNIHTSSSRAAMDRAIASMILRQGRIPFLKGKGMTDPNSYKMRDPFVLYVSLSSSPSSVVCSPCPKKVELQRPK